MPNLVMHPRAYSTIPVSGMNPATLLEDLVSWWALNEASGNAIDSHGTNHLTDGNTVGSAVGKVGNARDFEQSNSEYFTHLDTADLSTGDIDFTIAFWINFGTLPSLILSKGTNAGAGNTEYSFSAGGVGDLVFGVSGSGHTAVAPNGVATPYPSVVVTTGVWYFLVGWHDAVNNTVNLQVNNGTVFSTSYSDGTTDRDGAFWIGGGPTWGTYADGLIDEVAFWKRTLTTEERTWLHNAGVGRAYPSPWLVEQVGYTASVAYGLRRLTSTYSGSALRVRRASDSTEQDIGFTSSGVLDWASAISFKGASSLFVKTWYDQSGNGDDLVQATSADQAELDTDDQEIVFDGTNWYQATNVDLSATNKATYFWVARTTTNIDYMVPVEHNTGALANDITLALDASGDIAVESSVATVQNDDYWMNFGDGFDHLVTCIVDRSLTGASIVSGRMNRQPMNDRVGFTTTISGNLANATLNLGSRNGSAWLFIGSMKELVFFPTALNSAEYGAGEENIYAFYPAEAIEGGSWQSYPSDIIDGGDEADEWSDVIDAGNAGIVPVLWTPADLPDIVHWYRAAEIVASNDDPVSSWEDLIGTDDAAGVTTTRPLYKTGGGNPYVHFDGTDDKLTLANHPTGDFSIIVIWQYYAKKAYGMLLGNASGTLQVSYNNTNDELFFQTVGGGGSLTRSMPADPTGFMTGYFERVGSAAKLRVDGSETTGAVSGSAISGSWLIGEYGGAPGTYQGDIDVKELIVCDAAVTGGDFTDLAAYINSEYGLTL